MTGPDAACRPLGELLVAQGVLTERQVLEVLVWQQAQAAWRRWARFGEAARVLRLASTVQVDAALATQSQDQYVAPGTVGAALGLPGVPFS